MEEALIKAVGVKRLDIQRGVLSWASAYLRDYPWRKEEKSAYEVLIAEILLKRTTATAAARVYEGFLKAFPSVRHLAEATEEELAGALSNIGLYWQRAREIKKMALHLLREESGGIPRELDRLLKIPGVGYYNARAVQCFAHRIPTAVVDTNVERLLLRVFSDAFSSKPGQALLLDVAEKLLPEGDFKKFNWGLIDLGGLVCRYLRPLCQECPIKNVCYHFLSDKCEEAPSQHSKLREIRKEKGIGLASLAKKARVSKLTLIKIEAEKASPRPETISKLAKALEVKEESLKKNL